MLTLFLIITLKIRLVVKDPSVSLCQGMHTDIAKYETTSSALSVLFF